MKDYYTPEAEILRFTVQDIIRTSGDKNESTVAMEMKDEAPIV